MNQTEAVTVLLVEDNQVDVEAVKRAFKKRRVVNPIKVARDGVQALEMLRTPGVIPRPFLILLDLNMPRMNGLQFLQELRGDEELKNSIVFVLTTSSRDEDKLESYELNIAGYVVKRDVEDGLFRLIDMLDRYWRIVEFPPERR